MLIMMIPNPYDKFIKQGDYSCKRLHIMFIDVDEQLCDSCDQKKQVAIIEDLSGHEHPICKECLQSFVNAFEEVELEETI